MATTKVQIEFAADVRPLSRSLVRAIESIEHMRGMVVTTTRKNRTLLAWISPEMRKLERQRERALRRSRAQHSRKRGHGRQR